MPGNIPFDQLPDPCFCGLPRGTCCQVKKPSELDLLKTEVEALKLRTKELEDKLPKP